MNYNNKNCELKDIKINRTIDFTASRPDPRVILFVVILVSTVSCMLSKPIMIFVLFLIADAFLFSQKMIRESIRFLLVYITLAIIREIIVSLDIEYISMMVSILIVFVLHILPIYIACMIMFNKNPMNEMLTALEKMHIPKTLIIPIAVVYRYVPTIRQEIGCVRVSLKMRGLNPSLIGFIIHPMKMVENFMIPLLIRSAKIADELSASTLCKGLDLECERTCCCDVRFVPSDAIHCIIYLTIGILLLIVDNNIPFGELRYLLFH